jgi:hypothetical protein
MLTVAWLVLAISATPMLVADALFDPPTTDCVESSDNDNCQPEDTSTSVEDDTSGSQQRSTAQETADTTTRVGQDAGSGEKSSPNTSENNTIPAVEQKLDKLDTAAADTVPTAGTLAAPDPAPPVTYQAPTCFISKALAPGDSGPHVACLQLRLRDLSLYTGEITGTLDNASRDAVRAFQQTRPGLKVDGRPGKATLAELQLWKDPVPAAPVPAVPVPDTSPAGSNITPIVDSNYPNWAVSAAGIPYYAGRTACTPTQAATIMTEFARNGAGNATQQWAVYVASREAGCEHTRVNNNPATRDDSHCAFQLNTLSGLFTSNGALGKIGWTPDLVKLSLQTCADAASDFWAVCGRGPWTKPYYCRPSTDTGDTPTRQNGTIQPPATTTPPGTVAPAPETTVPAATTTVAPSDTATTTTTAPGP